MAAVTVHGNPAWRLTPDLPDVEALGRGQVLLRGAAVVDLYRLARTGVRMAEQRDGLVLPARIRDQLRVLAAAAREVEEMSVGGHADVRGEVDLSTSEALVGEFLDGQAVAQMLGIGTRQVRRLAPELEGRKHGRTWLFERTAVVAYAAEHRAS